MDLAETYQEVSFEASSNSFGFIHYDSGVLCDPTPVKN